MIKIDCEIPEEIAFKWIIAIAKYDFVFKEVFIMSKLFLYV